MSTFFVLGLSDIVVKKSLPFGAYILLEGNIINEQVNNISDSDKCFGRNKMKKYGLEVLEQCAVLNGLMRESLTGKVPEA